MSNKYYGKATRKSKIEVTFGELFVDGEKREPAEIPKFEDEGAMEVGTLKNMMQK